MMTGIPFPAHAIVMLYLTESKAAKAWRATSVSGKGTRTSAPGEASGSSATPGLAKPDPHERKIVLVEPADALGAVVCSSSG